MYDNTKPVNGTVGTLHFINTRIGVISYEVQFDWNVGDALTNGDIQSVTIAIKNPANNQRIEQTIDFSNLTQLDDGNYAFYFLNLPKYDTNGKLIEYQIEELSIKDENNHTYSVDSTKNEVTIGSGDKCHVTISSEEIVEGSEAKTDDLHKIIITNTFQDETSITVHKRWKDNSNLENTRSDLYIRLHGISEENLKKENISVEYAWEKHDDDTENYWTYTFNHLAKYDEKGYKYTYYVTEQNAQWLLERENNQVKIKENTDVRLSGYIQEYTNYK